MSGLDRLLGELDRVRSSLGAQVVHTGLETALPAVEMHGRELTRGDASHVDVETLTPVFLYKMSNENH